MTALYILTGIFTVMALQAATVFALQYPDQRNSKRELEGPRTRSTASVGAAEIIEHANSIITGE